MRAIVMLFSMALFVGCASGRYEVANQDLPINIIKAHIQKELPGGIRTTSANGREFTSQYFVPGDMLAIIPKGRSEDQRCYIKMEINGDRRPYSIYVTAPIETKTSKSAEGDKAYSPDGHDDKMAQDHAKLLAKKLAERQTKQNLFDDFRAF